MNFLTIPEPMIVKLVREQLYTQLRIPKSNLEDHSTIDHITNSVVYSFRMMVQGFEKTIVEVPRIEKRKIVVNGILKMPKWLSWLKIKVRCMSYIDSTTINTTINIKTFTPYFEDNGKTLHYMVANGEPFMMSPARFEALEALERVCRNMPDVPYPILNELIRIDRAKSEHEKIRYENRPFSPKNL